MFMNYKDAKYFKPHKHNKQKQHDTRLKKRL